MGLAEAEDRAGSGQIPDACGDAPRLDPIVERAFGSDAAAEFDSLASDAEDDAHLSALVQRASSGAGREHLSALSALSQQMSGFPPLAPADQAERLAIYRRGLAAQDEVNRGVRTERHAYREIAAGHRAQTELVGSMYRLALIICQELAAERYGRERMLEMLPDLVSEANAAVVEAVGTYDEARSPSFSLYAGRVMRDRVRMTLQRSSTVGVAPSWLRLKRIYTVLRPEVEMRLGRAPLEPEMQAELRVVCLRWAADRLTPEQQQLPAAERQELMESKLRKQGMLGAIDRLSEVLSATQQVTSLDAPVGEADGARVGDSLTAATGDSVYDEVEHAELRADLMAALSSLTEREREIILHKYGFVDGEPWTFAKLAPKFGVSAERIRQIERNVLARLRGPGFTNLAPHLPGYEP